MKKIRILQVVSILDMGGIETMLINYIKNINKELFQVDFLVHRDEPGYYDGQVLAEGCHIYKAPRISPSALNSYKKWSTQFFKDHPYDIVHAHLDALSYFPLYGAQTQNVPVRIAHSHVNNYDIDLKYPMRKYFARKIPKAATDYAACSKTAGAFMFPYAKTVTTIINPVDIEKYKYHQDSRVDLRSYYQIQEDTMVIGHVGRFADAKNHPFMLDLAKRFSNTNSVFVFVGAGPLFESIQEKAKKMELDNVIFTGVRNDVYAFYSMFDAFILPSHYEGLGNVAVEAQVAGLPVFISDGVNKDVMLTPAVTQIPLVLDKWEDSIQQLTQKRYAYHENLDRFDINTATVELEQYYSTLIQDAWRTL